MLRLAEENKELGIVHDQVGSPTYTTDLARFIISLVQTDKYGVYHGSNSGCALGMSLQKRYSSNLILK